MEKSHQARKKAYFMFILSLLLFMTMSGMNANPFQEKSPNQVFEPALFQDLHYRMIGPHRGGRVTAVAGHAAHVSTFYMGGTGGGVWKTTDYGQNWVNISDKYFAVGSIGAITVADSNPDIIYVGTGSTAIRSNVSTGRGVYKSSNGGKTWSFIGLREAGQIGSIVIHPQNPDVVYVAALGHVFGPNPERGIFRSMDGGQSWQKVLYISERTGAIDIAMNPSQPDEIYAAMWRGERKPWTIISGSLDGGIFKTTNGGDYWVRLTYGLPAGLVGKISISISPARPERIYALLEAPNDKGGVYRSDDAGITWQFINAQKELMYRPFYYTYIDADPKNADTVYINSEGFHKSVDGGKSFFKLRTPHGDNHGMWINPDNTDIFIQSNDGGANITLNGGKTWSIQHNQPTAEFYHVVVDNQFPYWVYGEQQDNSTIRVPSLPPISGRLISPLQHWQVVAGCETGPIAVSPIDPDIVYGVCKGRFSRYNHATGQEKQYWVYPYNNYGHAASEMPYRFQRTSPLEVSPHNPNVIYHASHLVHRTVDEGIHWDVISPDLTSNEPDKQGYSGEPITRDITGEEIYSAIYALEESLHEEGVIWVGSNDGLLHITRDGGEKWKEITPVGLPPGGRVQTIEPSPHHPGRAIVAVYRYMLDDWSPYIYRTEDYGDSWTRLTNGTNGIPADHPVRVVREDPYKQGILYAGTEFGMFISFDDGVHWQSLQLDLPATPVTDIKVHRKDLVLSTMGRSFWIMDDITPLHQLNENLMKAEAHLFEPRDAYRMRYSGFRLRPGSPEYPSPGILLSYYLAEDTGKQVDIKISDGRGNVIRNYSSKSTGSEKISRSAGMHRITWDLRYPAPFNLAAARFRDNGPMAVPGTYTVQLSVGRWNTSHIFRIIMDPRVAEDGVTQEDLEAQLALNLQIRETISRTSHAVARIRSERKKLGKKGTESDQNVQALVDELTAIEENLIQTKEGRIGSQLKPKLLRQLTYLYGMTTQADQRPGDDAFQRLQDIEAELTKFLTRLERVLKLLQDQS